MSPRRPANREEDFLRPSVRAAPGVHVFPLDEGGVLYCDQAQELRALDAAALFLWQRLQSGDSGSEIAERYAARFDVAADVARRVVADVLADWRERGWTVDDVAAGAAPPLAPRGPRPSPPPVPRGETAPRRPDAIERCYRILDTNFSLRVERGPLERVVLPVLAHLEASARNEPFVLLEIERTRAGFALLQDGTRVEEPVPLRAIAPVVKMHLRRLVTDRHRYFMQLHAAALLGRDGCWLLPGEAGSGKTTLSAALLGEGLSLLSDEVVLLESETLNVRPFPLALTVKCGAVAPLSDLHPELGSLPVHEREDGKRVRYLPPRRDCVAADHQQGYPIRGIVFPRYAPAEPGELRVLGRLEGLGRLLQACVSLPEWLARERVARLVHWMERLACYELSAPDLPDAVARLLPILQPHGWVYNSSREEIS